MIKMLFYIFNLKSFFISKFKKKLNNEFKINLII